MGAKVTIDSATMMNKGLELMEASWLFGMPAEKIEILVHPQSIVHSMVQFADGAVKAQDAAHAEVLLHAVNHVSQPEPPKHRAAHNGDVAHALPEEVAGNDKGKHVVEGDEEEDDQRVGERDEKRR